MTHKKKKKQIEQIDSKTKNSWIIFATKVCEEIFYLNPKKAMNRDKLPKLTRPTWYWHLLKKKKKSEKAMGKLKCSWWIGEQLNQAETLPSSVAKSLW